jgi:hypothetical protein
MTFKTSIVLIALALSCFSQSATAQGNLVVNGGFDTDASGWVITNIYVPYGGGYHSTFGDPPGSILLYNPNFGFSIPFPTASQEINSLTPGVLYVVSGDYRGGGKNVTDNSFGVALDGDFLFETAAPADFFSWHSFSFDYTATSTSALLSLEAQINGTDDSYTIDNISMEAVPEPTSFWLIGSGGIVSATFLSNRRKGLTIHDFEN